MTINEWPFMMVCDLLIIVDNGELWLMMHHGDPWWMIGLNEYPGFLWIFCDLSTKGLPQAVVKYDVLSAHPLIYQSRR